MKKDAIAETLRKDKDCKVILQDLVKSFPVGKSSFNKPGYISYATTKLFPHKFESRNKDKFDSYFSFYQKSGLVEINENTIDIKEKALNYI